MLEADLTEWDYTLLSILHRRPRLRMMILPRDLARLELLETGFFVKFENNHWYIDSRGEYVLEKKLGG